MLQPNSWPNWIVVCLDDDGDYVMATHRFFESWDEVTNHQRVIAPDRKALVVQVDKPIRRA